MKDSIRLDVYLAELKKDFSRNFYQKFIKSRGVEVNGKLIKKPHHLVDETDDIKIDKTAMELFSNSGISQGKVPDKNIIFSGNKFFVIDKPPFVTTEAIAKGFFPVHRLDKNTSGVLVIAKDPQTQHLFQLQWQERKVEKKYIALVAGTLPSAGEIKGAIARSVKNRTKMVLSAHPSAREAVTKYKTMRAFSIEGDEFTLLRAIPLTGRTHQIRVHFASIGHPIVGDEVYGDKKLNKKFEQGCGLKRQFLHAESLKLKHPTTKRSVIFTSKPPADLMAALKNQVP